MSQFPQVICVTLEWSQRRLLRQKHTHRQGEKKKNPGLGSGSSPGALWASQVIPSQSTNCIRDGLILAHFQLQGRRAVTEVQTKAGIQWKCRQGAQAGEQPSLVKGDAGDTCLPHQVSVQAGERSPFPGMLCPCRQILLWLVDILFKPLQPVAAMAVRRNSAWRWTFCIKVNSKLWVTTWKKTDTWGRSRKPSYYTSCNPSNEERIGCSLPLMTKALMYLTKLY